LLARHRLDHLAVVRLSFIVPRVRPGDYTIGFWCKPCAPPAGAFFTTAQPGQRWTPRQRRIEIVRISRCRHDFHQVAMTGAVAQRPRKESPRHKQLDRPSVTDMTP
jgi:hypothetical protein